MKAKNKGRKKERKQQREEERKKTAKRERKKENCKERKDATRADGSNEVHKKCQKNDPIDTNRIGIGKNYEKKIIL